MTHNHFGLLSLLQEFGTQIRIRLTQRDQLLVILTRTYHYNGVSSASISNQRIYMILSFLHLRGQLACINCRDGLPRLVPRPIPAYGASLSSRYLLCSRFKFVDFIRCDPDHVSIFLYRLFSIQHKILLLCSQSCHIDWMQQRTCLSVIALRVRRNEGSFLLVMLVILG